MMKFKNAEELSDFYEELQLSCDTIITDILKAQGKYETHSAFYVHDVDPLDVDILEVTYEGEHIHHSFDTAFLFDRKLLRNHIEALANESEYKKTLENEIQREKELRILNELSKKYNFKLVKKL